MPPMSGVYRATITTAGFNASVHYSLTDEDETDPRVSPLVEAGFLVRLDDLAEIEPEPTEPELIITERRTRTGVPELPPE